MAKIFVSSEDFIEPDNLPKGNNRNISFILDRLFWFLVSGMLLVVMILILTGLGEKRERNKDKYKEIMGLAVDVEMDNGYILTKQVKYETSKKIDPKDTSDIFFEVVNGNERYEAGDLVKFNHRFIQPQEIEGETYCILDPKQVQFIIRKGYVKTDLLKR